MSTRLRSELTSGPKRIAQSSCVSTSGSSRMSRRTARKSRAYQSEEHGRPLVASMSQPPARASARAVPVTRRTMCVQAVTPRTKEGKSAGCEMRRESTQRQKPRPLAVSQSRAVSGAKSEPSATIATGGCSLSVSNESSYSDHPIAAKRPACIGAGRSFEMLSPIGIAESSRKSRPAPTLTSALPARTVGNAADDGSPLAWSECTTSVAKRARNGMTS
mmetsp:Transcript_38464/g.81985  ORF Transcript_38464/g.81985 Transcript_38464/m.81985 type:complete len:218 (-) Transcript_38464:227-880(-)